MHDNPVAHFQTGYPQTWQTHLQRWAIAQIEQMLPMLTALPEGDARPVRAVIAAVRAEDTHALAQVRPRLVALARAHGMLLSFPGDDPIGDALCTMYEAAVALADLPQDVTNADRLERKRCRLEKLRRRLAREGRVTLPPTSPG